MSRRDANNEFKDKDCFVKPDRKSFNYKGKSFTEADVLMPRPMEEWKAMKERKEKSAARKAKASAKKEVKKGKQFSIKAFLKHS
jgi:hypothetical protein